ncbi:GyrI-like domain-containing protein [Flavobacterium microcysteis]|uniref:GyrI-like domain-containing protein n=1 Tax=Flavobacterium microcysteis TaxID=2596891 RepID=A0A501QJ41_9FLAO|nr:GyrI-like domain-containing protein [Flavobacterium microcysteis]TPD72135.1 GyrI-like domain-containing protein [Flavobacterium microcysteis]
MFVNIQKKLLLTHPLLWNSKIALFSILTLIFHLIFFLLGYSKGSIDFTDSNDFYDYGFDDTIIVFVSVLISIFMFIIWLVYYSRNNAFKSFYPKGKFSLYKEWLLILLFCILNSTFSASFFYAQDLKARNYFSEKELSKRLEIISLSSLFVEGPYRESNFITEQRNGEFVQVERDSFQYGSRNYSLKSLVNKQLKGFTYFNDKKDSLLELKGKRWLIENKKDSIQLLFKEFFKISKEHKLSSNITPEKWFELIYDYPEFTKYIDVGKTSKETSQNYNYYEGVNTDYIDADIVTDEAAALDTLSKTIKVVDGQKYVYSKYYVPFNALTKSYGKISRAYENPVVNLEFIMSLFYFSIGLSLCVFSFKITSGRNWLIAFVTLGLFGIISGIISVIISHSMTFPIIYILLFLGLLFYFAIILKAKESKGITGITINQTLWLMPAIIPISYAVLIDILKRTSGYYDSYTYGANGMERKQFPQIEWLDEHYMHMFGLNIVFVFLFLLLFSMYIKKWKGIAEA